MRFSYLLISLFCLISIPVQADTLQRIFVEKLAAAQAGSAEDMYATGQMYDLGMGVSKDRNQALHWYRAASKAQHPEAAYQLGYAFYWGRGVKKNLNEAFSWFSLAAEYGSRAAIPYLAKMNALGQGTKQNKQAAKRWGRYLETLEAEQAAESSQQLRETLEEQPALRADNTAPLAHTAVTNLLLAENWHEAKQPALLLPSTLTSCVAEEDLILCNGSSPQGATVASVLSAFSQQQRFTLQFSSEPLPGQNTPLQQDTLSCQVKENQIECTASDGHKRHFTKTATTPEPVPQIAEAPAAGEPKLETATAAQEIKVEDKTPTRPITATAAKPSVDVQTVTSATPESPTEPKFSTAATPAGPSTDSTKPSVADPAETEAQVEPTVTTSAAQIADTAQAPITEAAPETETNHQAAESTPESTAKRGRISGKPGHLHR